MSTWIKLHDNFWENPKVLAAGEDAALLYIQGLSYCSRNLTDGLIPTPALRNLTAKKDARTLARILVREGLWLETATGWQVHDYLKVQRSREQVEGERERGRERQAKSRSRNAVTAPVTRAVSHADVTPSVTRPETDTETDPLPSPSPVDCPDTIDPAQAEAVRALRQQFPSRMIVCPQCGNKRCPKASDDRFECSGSNEPGQIGVAALSASPPTWVAGSVEGQSAPSVPPGQAPYGLPIETVAECKGAAT